MPKYTINNGEGQKPTIINSQEELTPEEIDHIFSQQVKSKFSPEATEDIAKTKESKAGIPTDEARATGLGAAAPLAGPSGLIWDYLLKKNPSASEKVQAAAEGALSTVTGGLSEAAAAKAGVPLNDPESPRFREPGSFSAGEIGAVVLPAANLGRGTTALGTIARSAGTGALYGEAGGASKAITDNPNISLTEAALQGLPSAAVGVALGAAIPGAAYGAGKLAQNAKPTIEKLGENYRKILAPKKGTIQNLEIKSGKELKNSYELAAKEGLIIEKDPAGMLDTRYAMSQLDESMAPINKELSDAIASKPQSKFDILKLAEETKTQLRDHIKNDEKLQDARKMVDNEVAAILENRGQFIDGVELNEIKQGMWSKGYNAMAPNAQQSARVFGNVAKDAIEKAYPDADIKGLNSKLGEYVTLKNLLSGAHGNVVARGKLGRYAAQGVGAIAGHAIGIPIVGELGGSWLGGKVNDFLTDPARITGRLAKKASKLSEIEKQLLLKNAIEKNRPPALPPYNPINSAE